MMLAKFRQQYPQGSLVGELVKIDRGIYIVKVLLQADGVVLATALAGADTVEAAEDAARARAIATLILDTAESVSNTSSKATSVTTTDTIEPTPQAIAPKIEAPAIPQNVNFSEAEPAQPVVVSPAPNFTPDVPPVETPPAPLEPQPVAEAPVATGTLFDDAFTPEPARLEDYAVTPEPKPEEDLSFSTSELEAMDFNEIKQKTDIEIKRLGWTKDDGREFLKSRYGKRSRLHLTDEQLLEFLRYLEKLPNPVS